MTEKVNRTLGRKRVQEEQYEEKEDKVDKEPKAEKPVREGLRVIVEKARQQEKSQEEPTKGVGAEKAKDSKEKEPKVQE